MKLKFNGHIIETYDSIQDLPIVRFQKYNLSVLIDGGIGGDLESFDKRINKIRHLVVSAPKDAQTELTNIQQNVRFIMSQTTPEFKSFVALIKKIDNRELKDSDLEGEGITDIIKELGEKKLPYSMLRNFLQVFKKKIQLEFDLFFPEVVDSVKIKEYYTKLKQRTILVLQEIQGLAIDAETQINEIDAFLIASFRPKNYHGRDGVEVRMIKGYEETCVILSQNKVSNNPRAMTTLSFYQALEVVKAQIKKR